MVGANELAVMFEGDRDFGSTRNEEMTTREGRPHPLEMYSRLAFRVAPLSALPSVGLACQGR
jgi:hypothetical protein